MKFSDVVISLSINGYSALLSLIRIVVFPFLKEMSRRKGWDLEERQKLPTAIRDYRKKTVVWVHAASLGEAKLLCKFLQILEQRNPQDMYVVTATTKTGVQFLKKNSPVTVCAIGFFPLDTISLIKNVIKRFNITRVWLLETELWPSMLWTCRHLNIPLGIINARMEEDSFERYHRFRFFLSYFFKGFDVLLAQSKAYADRFEALGVKRECIHVVGNIKGHVLIKRPPVQEWESTRKALGLTENDMVITCGCIHTGEGKVLRECFEALKVNGISCKMIIVPRYIEEVPEIIKEIGLEALLLTDVSTFRKWEICVIERMGILDNMYMIADAAVIGGTFISIGGHNVWDAARFGIPVFFGPDYHTQVEGCEKLVSHGVGFKSEDGSSLAALIADVMKTDPQRFVHSQLQFIEEINKSQSVLEPLIP